MLKSRVLRLLMWTLLAVALLIAAAWLAVPPLLKWQLETRGSELLGRELRVDAVEFVPPTLELTLRGLSIGAAADSENRTPQLQIERLFVDLDARSLLRLAPVIAALEIDAPRLRLTRRADGRSDIEDLLQRFAPAPSSPPSEPARFALFNLRLSDGEVLLDDRVVGRQHALRKITLGLPFLSNLPADVQITVEPQLAFELNGSHFDNHGRSTPFAEGRASELQVQFEKLDLGPMWAYAPESLPVRPTGGLLSADLTLTFQQPDKGGPQLGVKGQVALDEVGVKLASGAPLLSWQSLRVALADVRPLQQRIALDSVHLAGARVHLRRDAQGRIELLQLAASAPPAAASAASAAAARPKADWQVQVGSVELKDAQVHWTDNALQPAAELQLDGLALQLKNMRWPADADATLQLEGGLSAQGKAAGKLHAEGQFTDRQAKLAFKLGAIDLAPLAGPYLQQYLRPQASARIAADGTLDWARGDAGRLELLLSSLQVDDFRLAEPAAARAKSRNAALAQWARLELADLRADLLQQRVTIGRLSLQKPQAELTRDAGGALNAQQWFKEADTPATRAVEGGPPWKLELREFKLDGGRVRLADAALRDGPLELSALRVAAQGLAWPLAAGAAPLETQLSATLSAPRREATTMPARLDWRGRVGIEPLAAKGQLRVERLPVHAFEPYFGAQLPVTLQRLEAGFRGQVDLQQPAGASPALRLQGDALLADLRVLGRSTGASAAGSELLSWNALNLNGLDLGLQPDAKPRITIRELRLTDFFSRLEITEEGRFNLQTVATGPKQEAAPPAAPASAPVPTPAPAVSAAASGSADTSVLSRLPVELLIEGMQFSNGRIDFRDRFIRPNYSADLTELNGRIGRLDSRSRDMATLQFSGRVAGTGLLEIGGALNPTVIPPALDIQAKARDIELPGLTPYSSKYAGYPIERGKLSMSVAYKIESDGKLEARNQIIVNQLTFGPKTDSPDAVNLPVPLVVALLQDKNGVIDLDIPLTGSINDPQFSMGALIWKVIVNLFTKIVSSPFAVIGGGGQDLSHVDFRPGTAQIADSSQEVIAKVAKALDDRPALKLGILATADPVSEHKAMQQAAFEARLRAEQRRERARGALGSAGSADAPLPPLTAEQRAQLVKQIYSDTKLPDKPRNAIGLIKDIPVAEMEAMLVASMPVDEATAKELATRRGRTVRELLMSKGLGSERLFLSEPKLRGQEGDKGNKADNTPWVPQAQLTLSAN